MSPDRNISNDDDDTDDGNYVGNYQHLLSAHLGSCITPSTSPTSSRLILIASLEEAINILTSF